MAGGRDQLDVDVAVVGAGLAGLAAARALAKSGAAVVVVEAKQRVGGRLKRGVLGGGVVVDLGGQWLGAGQRRLAALAQRLGHTTFPTHTAGESVLVHRGRTRRYSGTIPKLSPLVLLDVWLARRKIDRLAGRVPTASPWNAADAASLDRQTLAGWLARHMRTASARELFAIAGRTIWGTDPEELSLLHALFYVAGAGGIDRLLDVEGGAQQDRFSRGAHALAQALADELGPAVHLARPVERVAQERGSVSIAAAGLEVRASRAVLALPPPLCAAIRFEPELPGIRRQLAQRMPLGTLTKCFALYDEPFWRADGLSGEALSDADAVGLVFDCSPEDGSCGVLLGFVGGADARAFAREEPQARRRAVLRGFARLFGERAAQPADYAEQAWADEPFSAGGPTAGFAPGGWTGFGRELRRPCGRIHWAGTETATEWSGFMEGALESAERAVRELEAAGG